jgi:hypothetical protein
MSTRSTIGYETEDGDYVGVYCHFDGYPGHVIPVLANSLGWKKVRDNVEIALTRGGFRDVEGWENYNEPSAREEWLQSSWPCTANSYNYRVRLDGTIDCVNYSGEIIPV